MIPIKIYDRNGIVVDLIRIDDNITFLGGRVSKGEKCYYKGIGIPYKGRWTNDNPQGFPVLRTSDVFYMGSLIEEPHFKNKFGIFQEKYQPMFADFVGTCGVKELSIIENSVLFERSSVDILKSVNFDKINHQYYFELNYKCGRKKYLDEGKPSHIRNLLDYMINEKWNFNWDKDSISDISHDGRVTDVADIFKSSDLNNMIGSVYSVLYSMCKKNTNKYLEFVKANNLQHTNSMDFVFNSISILNANGVEIPMNHSTLFENYRDIVLNRLVVGKNCGHCSYLDLGDKIKEEYIKRASKELSVDISAL